MFSELHRDLPFCFFTISFQDGRSIPDSPFVRTIFIFIAAIIIDTKFCSSKS